MSCQSSDSYIFAPALHHTKNQNEGEIKVTMELFSPFNSVRQNSIAQDLFFAGWYEDCDVLSGNQHLLHIYSHETSQAWMFSTEYHSLINVFHN